MEELPKLYYSQDDQQPYFIYKLADNSDVFRRPINVYFTYATQSDSQR